MINICLSYSKGVVNLIYLQMCVFGIKYDLLITHLATNHRLKKRVNGVGASS